MHYPGATWKPISANVNPAWSMSAHLGLILHVQVGEGSLFGWFNDSQAQASAHFWVSKTGKIEQYVDTEICAWAEEAGNPYYLSVESEGTPDEPLTEAQIDSLARLYIWVHDTYGAPYQLANLPGQSGLGTHGMGGEAWGHPMCPGVIRTAQRSDILAAAEAIINPPKPAPEPEPTPTPAPTSQEDEMYVIFRTVASPDAYEVSPNGRRHVSGQEAEARRAAGQNVQILVLPETDPVWKLPVTVA